MVGKGQIDTFFKKPLGGGSLMYYVSNCMMFNIRFMLKDFSIMLIKVVVVVIVAAYSLEPQDF